MPPKTNAGSKTLGASIKSRRTDLGLTISEAAKRAGVTEKTWIRYESGESIRTDKTKGVLRALNWKNFPNEEAASTEEDLFQLVDSTHEAWSPRLAETYGPYTATLFAAGSDIAMDQTKEDLQELSVMPRGTHLGELGFSWLADQLPQRFLMRYDYEFVYALLDSIFKLRRMAHWNQQIAPDSVMDELALHLILEAGECHLELFDAIDGYLGECPEGLSDELFSDIDCYTCLYEEVFPVFPGHMYHFDSWQQSFSDPCE